MRISLHGGIPGIHHPLRRYFGFRGNFHVSHDPEKTEEKLSKLAALSFAFIIAGIIFGEDRLIGYGLLGAGVLLAVVDIYCKLRTGQCAA
jgi:hypothetical protein